jgi:DNA phosphorothioation-dependent restriction protein DptG
MTNTIRRPRGKTRIQWLKHCVSVCLDYRSSTGNVLIAMSEIQRLTGIALRDSRKADFAELVKELKE